LLLSLFFSWKANGGLFLGWSLHCLFRRFPFFFIVFLFFGRSEIRPSDPFFPSCEYAGEAIFPPLFSALPFQKGKRPSLQARREFFFAHRPEFPPFPFLPRHSLFDTFHLSRVPQKSKVRGLHSLPIFLLLRSFSRDYRCFFSVILDACRADPLLDAMQTTSPSPFLKGTPPHASVALSFQQLCFLSDCFFSSFFLELPPHRIPFFRVARSFKAQCTDASFFFFFVENETSLLVK